MIPSNSYVVEFSHSQKTFHVHIYKSMLKKNRAAYTKQRPSDWIPLGFFPTSEEAHSFIKTIDPDGKFAI